MLCYNMIKKAASGIIYGQYKKKSGEESIIGRPRSLSMFEEFTLVMMRLRLGLFEKALGHRFGVHGVYYFPCLDTFSTQRV